MSVESGEEAPVEPGERPPRFNRWLTGAALGLLGVLAVLVFWPAYPLDTLERPEQSLERVVTRELDLRAAVRAAPAWERRLHALTLTSGRGAVADAIDWYDELVQEEGSPLAELYRMVLLAESGRADALQAAVAAWTPEDDAAGRLATWARAAYGPESAGLDQLRAAIAGVGRELPAGWFADRLVGRLASRLGDEAAVATAEGAIQARGARLLGRVRLILAVEAGLVALGVWAIAILVLAPGLRALRVGRAPIPPHWTVGEGVALFTRGAVGLLGVAVLWPLLPDRPSSELLISVLSAMPLCGYLVWYCRKSGTTVRETFGLRLSDARPALARATLALVGVATVGDLILEVGGARLGLGPHWTDGFQERLVWGTGPEVTVNIVDGVIVAPILEELLFRGVLYGTLRLRFGPGPATMASAALFALAHGYGVIGFTSVLMSGVLWAVSYERTRSLLPGMLAHAANNLQATLFVLATLRF